MRKIDAENFNADKRVLLLPHHRASISITVASLPQIHNTRKVARLASQTWSSDSELRVCVPTQGFRVFFYSEPSAEKYIVHTVFAKQLLETKNVLMSLFFI